MNRITVDMAVVPKSLVYRGGNVIYGHSMTCGPGWVTVVTRTGVRHHFPISNVARIVEEDVDE